MTQDKNEGSENLNWMEIAETDAVNDVRHSGQRLPFIAAAVSLLIIGGGAVFAQTSNEAPAQAEDISVSQIAQTPLSSSNSTVTPSSVTAPSIGAPSMTSVGVPVIPNVAPGANGSYDDDEDEDDEYEDDDHDEDEDDD
jgi:hypothetical protein